MRDGDNVFEGGIFVDEAALAVEEYSLLRAAAQQRGLVFRDVRDFVEEVLFEECAKLNGTCVGFNLPFDLSRIAIGHGTAKSTAKSRKFQHGFSLQMSSDEYRPRIRIKHLSHRASFIEFVVSKEGLEAKDRRVDAGLPARPPGFFVDVKTLAGVLLAESYDLEHLCIDLDTKTKKQSRDDHGKALTAEYVGYALDDVQATWECYLELTKRLAAHGLPQAKAHGLISEASLGKAYLQAMNVRPWIEAQADFPPELIGQILSTYYGGRSEVHIRREVRRSFYCDFLSMYPTVNTLMGLWKFVIATGIDHRDATSDAQRILDEWTPDDLQRQENWKRLPILVQLSPDDDVLPVRAVYGDGWPRYEANKMANIGLNRLTFEAPLWFTLADCLASKFLSGKTPKVQRAIAFSPREQQEGLRSVNVAGDEAFAVDPTRQDFFKALIDMRRSIKQTMKSAEGQTKVLLGGRDLAIKILANSTSYGIFVETLVEDLEARQPISRYGFDGKRVTVTSKVEERPGRYFHPLLATLITGAARLMLSLAERKAQDVGLDWVFCDTDGIAFAKPDAQSDAEFYEASDRVRSWFGTLNPYEPIPGSTAQDSILKAEDENFVSLGHNKVSDELAPLFTYAVSAKRYALFHKTNGKVDLRKASAHGLGHLLPPYVALAASGWEQSSKAAYWHEQVWIQICEAALLEQEDELDFATNPRLLAPAASRYGANTPDLVRWFDDFNAGRNYLDQVRPFGFLLSYQVRNLTILSATDPNAATWGREHKSPPRPASIFDKRPAIAAELAFDRATGTSVPVEWLKSYSEALAGYHLHDEAKFVGGAKIQRGVLERRHIDAIAVRHIGKEAHNWEEDYFVGSDGDNEIQFGTGIFNPARLIAEIRRGREAFGVRAVCSAAGISSTTLSGILDGASRAESESIVQTRRAVFVLGTESEAATAKADRALRIVQKRIEEFGLTVVAGELGLDPSNLAKSLSRTRKLPQRVVDNITPTSVTIGDSPQRIVE